MSQEYNEYEGVNTIESEVTCPYCKHQFSDSWEHHWEDGEGDTVECDKCGKKFDVVMCVTVDYRSHQNCALNGEAHEWRKAWWAKTSESEECKKCGMNRYPKPDYSKPRPVDKGDKN